VSGDRTRGVERSVDDLTVAEIDVSDLLPAVLERFESRGLRYLIQRNYEHFPHRAYRRDIGLLVDHRQARPMVALIREACAARGYAFEPGRRDAGSVIVYAVRSAAPDDASGAPPERLKFDARTYEPFSRPGRVRGWPDYRVLFEQMRLRRVERHGCVFHVPGQPDEMILLFKQWRRKGLTRHRLQLTQMLREEEVRRWFREATGSGDAAIDSLLAGAYRNEYDELLWRMAAHRWGGSAARVIGNLARTTWARLMLR
jgi:hypothetical protein